MTTNSAVLRFSDVDLDHFDAQGDRIPDALDGILGVNDPAVLHPAAAMSDDHHMVAPEICVLEALEYLFDPGALGLSGRTNPASAAARIATQEIPRMRIAPMTKRDARGLRESA